MDITADHDRFTDAEQRGGTLSLLASMIGVCVTVVACAFALVPTLRVLGGGPDLVLRIPWDAAHGDFSIGLDALGAFFLLPVLVISAMSAVYGGYYLLAFRRKKSLGWSWLFFNLLVAGMVMVVLSRTALLFLMSWEVMSLSAYFLLTFEQEKAEVRKAGWVYLVAAHLGVAFLFAAFVLLGRLAGSLDFEAFRSMAYPGLGWTGLIFVLAVIGFGTKAGFFPFHVWVPEAYSAAPPHVAAIMSGAMSKLGIYGLLRILSFVGPPAPWWGPTLVAIGFVTALFGVVLALNQRDVARVVAYSSVENLGLIGMAIGVGLWGRSSALPAVAALGMAGAMLHVWNHSLMKGLMFLATGSAVRGAGTRDIEKLGGLMKRMPWTGIAMIVGSVAICGLPPLNGFVSEWLMYLSLAKRGLGSPDVHGLAALLSVGVLALIGGLAAITFVRLSGIVLLGSPRCDRTAQARESSLGMILPMAVLAVLCVVVALMPQRTVDPIDRILIPVIGAKPGILRAEMLAGRAPIHAVGFANAWIVALLGVTVGVFVYLIRKGSIARGPTWGCGYVLPNSRMQYTGRSFARMVGERGLPRFLRPISTRSAPHGLFPSRSSFGTHIADPVKESVYEPMFRRWAGASQRLRILQQGKIHVYLMYIGITVVLALTWVSVRG